MEKLNVKRTEPHKITITVNCIQCHEDFEYELVLPTAVMCTHCSSLIDARLALHKHEQ
jgi:formylmethanofuran dehydrogenase subunit E